MLSIFGFMNSLFTLARAFSFSYGGLRAAVEVHAELLSKLVNAPVYFFDQNPSGRILNRSGIRTPIFFYEASWYIEY